MVIFTCQNGLYLIKHALESSHAHGYCMMIELHQSNELNYISAKPAEQRGICFR